MKPDDLSITDESLSSLFQEINNYTPKTPLKREPSVRAASGSFEPSKRVSNNASSRKGQGQIVQTAVNRPKQSIPYAGQTRQPVSYDSKRYSRQPTQPTVPRHQTNEYVQQSVPVQKKKDHGFLKFIIGIAIFLALLRACGIISSDKDTSSTKVEETVAVEEEIVEVPEEETVDLVFDSKYLIKHGPAEQLERLTLRLDSGEFTRTKDGKLAITTKRNELQEKIVQYLSDELPNVSRADYPNFLEITSNDDFTEFEFKVAAATLYQHEENYMKDVLMIAQMNAELKGNPNEVITIVFKNLNGDVLREKDTKVSG